MRLLLLQQWRELPQEMGRTLVTSFVDIKIPLMIVLRIPPIASRQNLGRNTLFPPFLSHLRRQTPRLLLLRLIMKENRTPILTARIRSLAINSRRIMHLIEELQQRSIRHLLRIKPDLQRLCMSGAAGAYGAVGRVRGIAADVADAGVEQLRRGEVVAVHVLDAPEAAGGYCAEGCAVCGGGGEDLAWWGGGGGGGGWGQGGGAGREGAEDAGEEVGVECHCCCEEEDGYWNEDGGGQIAVYPRQIDDCD